MVKEQAYYKDGVHKTIYESHAWRTVENSMQFTVPLIHPSFKILDVGSGPGTITIDYGKYVPDGSVIGVEPTSELIEVANSKKVEAGNPQNVSFQLGSIYKLPFEDNSFDLVVAHQVVVHLEDPVAALKELRRVTKSNGYVAVKDADLKAGVIYPESYEKFFDLYIQGKCSGGSFTDPIAGRRLKEKALNAGYLPSNLELSSSVWTVANAQEREMWATMFLNRLRYSQELFSPDENKNKELKKLAIEMWEKWAKEDSGFLSFMNVELLYKK
ncbi:S-adenosyl-L-methionine-dependent methyltransferase [Suhomyces tanzawaensis NRRL Y-17324]|uniref:S-adenosyl-L-methionine-dependent methyltransferase n=1 Tax=Suhomyces tanzawaensis NRRL Y-17324 TaxID=984487 RepID=A0A1E4SKK3_9ASCO|nr:S-adenosyl-L-methionine-dependent methyltransferase [Suhomyces tanzawaensis NRRL Y-17324]ODV80039.1 S-adenosyl-L-methionine-dependent methyltransferase [Suhomyces tanzawaensis NRRL Y-17324]